MTTSHIQDQLKAAQFRSYPNAHSLSHESADSEWQRKFYDSNGDIKYFINAYVYGDKVCQLGHESRVISESVEFEAILYLRNRENEWVTLTLHESGVQRAISFFYSAFNALGCENDRHN